MLFNSKRDTRSKPLRELQRSGDSARWRRIVEEDLSAWNKKLLSTEAHYRQYPFWCEPFRNAGDFKPHFYVYGTQRYDEAFVCILEGNFVSIKFGLILRGPVSLTHEELSENVLIELIAMAEGEGYDFLRFTHQSPCVVEYCSHQRNSRRVESFPSFRDPPKSLVVTQAETDSEMLSCFQPVARREIRAGEKAGYSIGRSDSIEDYCRVWPMFERLAANKGFSLSNRTLDFWLQVVGAAREQGCSTLYTATLGGECVSAVHVLRYGSTAEFMLGALDLERLGKNASPSALIHWTAMRDQYSNGCRYYNLGGPGDGITNKVYQFKRKFRPTLTAVQSPVTIILNPITYRLWDLAVLKGWFGLRRQAWRVVSKSEDLYCGVKQRFFGGK